MYDLQISVINFCVKPNHSPVFDSASRPSTYEERGDGERIGLSFF